MSKAPIKDAPAFQEAIEANTQLFRDWQEDQVLGWPEKKRVDLAYDTALARSIGQFAAAEYDWEAHSVLTKSARAIEARKRKGEILTVEEQALLVASKV